MEGHPSNRSIMLVKSANQGPHLVVPELDITIV
jgi:hypothetical protein